MGLGFSAVNSPAFEEVPLEEPELTNNRVRVSRASPTAGKCLRIVCISDTHTRHRKLEVPAGDVLIHCGDFTNHRTSKRDVHDFNEWLGTLPHKHKIVIGGNHDKSLAAHNLAKTRALLTNCTYLQDEEVNIDGVRIYGAPWQPQRPFWYRANNFSLSASSIRRKWKSVPTGVDVLLTHVPPLCVLDLGRKGKREGCPWLRHHLLHRIKPRLHVFGHCHDGHGVARIMLTSKDKPREKEGKEEEEADGGQEEVNFVNAAQALCWQPIVVDYHY